MLDKTKTYMVLNYDTSPIAITTRNHNELIPAGNDDEPAMLPLTIDEIIYINSTSKVFKIGKLFFEPEYEKDIYDELHIKDWKNILRNSDIYEIILNPTVENLERILEITEPMYFDRIYGAYIGLSNAGASVSGNVENVLKARYKEFVAHKRKTEIKVRPIEAEKQSADDARVADLQSQLEEMKAMIAKLTAAQATATQDSAVGEDLKAVKPKTTQTRQTKSTSTQRKKTTSSTKSSAPKE